MSRILCLFVVSLCFGLVSASASIVFEMPRLTFPNDGDDGLQATRGGGTSTLPSTPQR